jgi:hypothetical protein
MHKVCVGMETNNRRQNRIERSAVALLDGVRISEIEASELLKESSPGALKTFAYHRVEALIVDRVRTLYGQEFVNRHADLELPGLVKKSSEIEIALIEFRKSASEIAQALDDAGVDYVFLKGIQLLETIYAGRPVRPMGDIDLLVSDSDVKTASAVLEKLGYSHPERQVAAWALRRFHYEMTFERGIVDVDLHWGIDHPLSAYSVDTDLILARRENYLVGTELFSGVSVELMLVHLILHVDRESNLSLLGRSLEDSALFVSEAETEGWPYLIRLFDIAELLETNRGDFSEHRLTDVVAKYGIEAPARHVLSMCADVFPRKMSEWSDEILGMSETATIGLTSISRWTERLVGDRHLAGLNMRPVRLMVLLSLLLLGRNQELTKSTRRGVITLLATPIRLCEIVWRISWGASWAVAGQLARSLFK